MRILLVAVLIGISIAFEENVHGHSDSSSLELNDDKPTWIRPTLQLPKFGSKAVLNAELKNEGVSRFTSSNFKKGIVKHIVLFKLKDTVTAKQALEVKRQFFALKVLCKRDGQPYIESIDGGDQYGGEDVNGGFQYAFIVTFKSEGDRNYYVGEPIVTHSSFYDPAHQRFKEFVSLFLADDGALVFDFRV